MAEPEADLELGDGEITGNVRLVQTCAECGTELAEANLDVSESFELEHSDECTDPDLELTVDEATNDERWEGRGRYAKHFYIAKVASTIKCNGCIAEQLVDFEVEEQASFFDSLV